LLIFCRINYYTKQHIEIYTFMKDAIFEYVIVLHCNMIDIFETKYVFSSFLYSQIILSLFCDPMFLILVINRNVYITIKKGIKNKLVYKY
jgi:hypothetical protein